MKIIMMRCAVLVGALAAASPSAAFAHDGHAGHHGWLAGAMEPLLSLDHFLAALFVMAVLSVGLTVMLRRGDATDRTRWY